MSQQLGRISGPLLSANLLREGVDLRFQNNLLYLDVDGRRISIKDTPINKELFINGNFLSKNVIVDNLFAWQNIEIAPPNTIRSTSGSLKFAGTDYVSSNNIRVDSLDFSINRISTVTTNTDIELRPDGTGVTNVFANTNVTGSIHATGNITADGSIIFGDQDTDSVTFNSDITSDLIPDQDNFYSLGTSQKRWKDFQITAVNATTINAGNITTPSGVDPSLTPGRTWFVATNGSDSNNGDHENSPFASIKYALTNSLIQPGDTVHIYPGTYIEDFPLTIPVGVTVNGQSLRSVTVTPTTATKNKDAFLVNGETTLAEITIDDFFYDSVNNTGYGVRFAPGFKVTTRSPYIQNLTIRTKGSVTSSTDPLGFDQGDAGRGILVDGSVADPTTKEASLLCHAVTLIVPNSIALYMLNGVRVEWLNSFIYFADKGMYATNGSAGLSSLGIRFGAEVRSIASATVYGNYGAWADGASTLMYLINYNFAYIGTGKDSSNDISLTVQANEVTEINNGKIYYQSVDQSGNFRVGEEFWVDFNRGTTSIVVTEGNVLGLAELRITTGGETTVLSATKVDIGNLVLRDNTLASNFGPINIVSANGEIYFNLNTSINNNLDVAGNFNIDGQLFLGNQSVDTVGFAADIDSDLIPKLNNTYTVGEDLKRWLKVWTNEGYIGNFTIAGNTISIDTNNTNFVLSANGTGTVSIPSNNVLISNDLTVNRTTTTKNIEVNGSIIDTGNVLQTGNSFRTGDTDITGNLTVGNVVQFQDIKFENNTVTTTIGNNDLRLVSTGTEIYIPDNNVVMDQNLTVGGTTNFNSLSLTSSRVTANQFSTGDILIDDNYITTTIGDNNLELRAAGTGKVLVPLDDVQFDRNLAVNKQTSTKNISISGNTSQTGNVLQTGTIGRTGNTEITGSVTISGTAQYERIRIETKTLSATATNTDLRLVANGTGKISIPTSNVVIEQNLTVNGTTNINSLSVTNTITADQFTTGDILIDDNFITTTLTNSNLELRANGTGKILTPTNTFEIVNNLTVNGNTELRSTGIVGTLTLVGNKTHTGSTAQTGSTDISGTLTVNTDATFPQITIINNRISTRTGNTDLELRAAGTGRIYVPSDNVRFDQTLTVLGTTSTANITSSGTITADRFTTGDIVIDDNFTLTSVGNNNLILTANNNGAVVFERLSVRNNILASTQTNANIVLTPGTEKIVTISSTNALKLPVGTTANRTTGVQGDLRFNTNDNLFGGWSTARRTFGGVYSADRLTFARAHPTNNTIGFVAATVPAMDVLTDRLRLNGLRISNNFLLDGTVITNLNNNVDLTLTPSSNKTVVNSLSVVDNTLTNLVDNSALTFATTGDGHVKFKGTAGVVIPVGIDNERPAPAEIGALRFNTEQEYTEIYDGTKWIPIIGDVEAATLSEITEIGDLWTLILG